VGGLDKLLEDLHIVNVEDLEAVRHAVNLDTTDRPAGDPEPEQGRSTKPRLELLLGRALCLVTLPGEVKDLARSWMHGAGLFRAWGNRQNGAARSPVG
jgi:hypothetical protein